MMIGSSCVATEISARSSAAAGAAGRSFVHDGAAGCSVRFGCSACFGCSTRFGSGGAYGAASSAVSSTSSCTVDAAQRSAAASGSRSLFEIARARSTALLRTFAADAWTLVMCVSMRLPRLPASFSVGSSAPAASASSRPINFSFRPLQRSILAPCRSKNVSTASLARTRSSLIGSRRSGDSPDGSTSSSPIGVKWMISVSRRSTSAWAVNGWQGSGRDASVMPAAGASSMSAAAAAVSLPVISFIGLICNAGASQLEAGGSSWELEVTLGESDEWLSCGCSS
mmetsp:Transcript_48175/g.142406  ORF Transcript_48175/g.142406 Transcript_48175/m.142406 type:complete len:283 (+) Transcript_48175:293-1141(+)